MIKKKLKQKSGETLVETLISLLIIAPGMVMLAGAIVAAAKINVEMKDADTLKFPTYTSTYEDTISWPAEVVDKEGHADPDFTSIDLDWKREKNSAYYYLQ